jgi:hypothetical protein
MPYVAPPELGNYYATISINIPRLRRSGIREFASSISPRRTPNILAIFARSRRRIDMWNFRLFPENPEGVVVDLFGFTIRSRD